jgi:hypothetical protein
VKGVDLAPYKSGIKENGSVVVRFITTCLMPRPMEHFGAIHRLLEQEGDVLADQGNEILQTFIERIVSKERGAEETCYYLRAAEHVLVKGNKNGYFDAQKV